MPLVDPADFIHEGENTTELLIDGTIVLAVFSKEAASREFATRLTKTSVLVPKSSVSAIAAFEQFSRDGDLKELEGEIVFKGEQKFTIQEAISVGQDQFWRLGLKRA